MGSGGLLGGILNPVSDLLFGKPPEPEAPEPLYTATEEEDEETDVETGSGKDKGANRERSSGRSSLMADKPSSAAPKTGLNI